MKKLSNLTGPKLVAAVAVIICVVWTAANLIGFANEAVSRSSGKMQTVTLSAQDFQLIGIKDAANGGLISTDADPQMVLECSTKMARITLNCTFAIEPGEMVVYYTQKAGQGFHPNKRYRFYATEDGSYTADMPLRHIETIRIDPTNIAANTMNVDSVVLNAPKSFGQFFAVDAGDIFNLILYSTLISALITLSKEIFGGIFAKKSDKRG